MKSKYKTPDPKKAKRYFSRKLAFTTGPVELSRWLKERKDVKVIDVRDTDSYAKGHIPGAINLPQEKWHKTAALEKSKTQVVYCYTQTCHLATRAALEFATSGFPVVELEGGFETWKEKGLPTEKRSAQKAAHKSRKAHKPQAETTETAEAHAEPEVEVQTAEPTPAQAN